ncbi:MAG: purine-nucleoside phosphorylase [Oscillospiraceae bacterium]|nr:purine-nucleoside phosphorylase [Oscillospiraceae bacterium]
MEDNAITGAVFGRFDAERYYQTLLDCVRQIKERTDFIPDTAVVLGSGLGHFVDAMDVAAEIPYSEIDGFPVSTVAGHQGKLVFGEIGGKKVAAMQGRVHYYEGYDVHDVVIPIRVLKLLGAKTAVFTNAVGAINTDYRPGDFVALRDHISSFTPSPLVGENIAQLGERFTPVTDLYDKGLRELAISIGQEKDIRVHSGVFLQVTGPQYETPAEIRMFRLLGADTVGMSTAIEATAAKHMGMRVCAINCVTNMAAGIYDSVPSHEEVTAIANKAGKDFSTLLKELITRMD